MKQVIYLSLVTACGIGEAGERLTDSGGRSEEGDDSAA